MTAHQVLVTTANAWPDARTCGGEGSSLPCLCTGPARHPGYCRCRRLSSAGSAGARPTLKMLGQWDRKVIEADVSTNLKPREAHACMEPRAFKQSTCANEAGSVSASSKRRRTPKSPVWVAPAAAKAARTTSSGLAMQGSILAPRDNAQVSTVSNIAVSPEDVLRASRRYVVLEGCRYVCINVSVGYKIRQACTEVRE